MVFSPKKPAWCNGVQFSRRHGPDTPDCDKRELPEYDYSDIRHDLMLDPRMELGKALRGALFESKRIEGWTIMQAKYER
mgnify:FL=1